MTEPIVVASDAATSIFNLPDYRVISAAVLVDGRRQDIVETDQPPGCPTCGVVATRRKERRFQRIRDIPVAGAVEVFWPKYPWYCEERACARLSFFESTSQVPRHARSTSRLRDHVVRTVIDSGRAVSETASAFAPAWRLGVQVVAIDPSAAFRKALRMWLPPPPWPSIISIWSPWAARLRLRPRQNLSQQVKGRCRRGIDKAWAHRMRLLRAGDTLTENAAHRLAEVFAADDPTGKLEAVWRVKEQLRYASAHELPRGRSTDAKDELRALVEAAGRPVTNKLYRTVCRWWKEIEVLVGTSATTGKVEANNIGIKHIKHTARGYRNTGNYKSVIRMRSAVRTAAEH